MNKENRFKLNVASYVLTKKLGFKPENIMITGSLALDIMGVLSKPAGDADFIIRMSDDEWKMMKLYATINGEKSFYPQGCDNVTVTIQGVKLNIFYTPNKYEYKGIKDSSTGFWVSNARDIIKAKKSYGRSKDNKDLIDICKEILA